MRRQPPVVRKNVTFHLNSETGHPSDAPPEKLRVGLLCLLNDIYGDDICASIRDFNQLAIAIELREEIAVECHAGFFSSMASLLVAWRRQSHRFHSTDLD